MFSIEIHSLINRLDVILYIFGVWQNESTTVARKTGVYLFYLIFSFGFTISIIWGAVIADTKDESLFLGASAIYSVVFVVRNNHIRWKRDTILSFLKDNCAHSFTCERDFISINKKLEKFMNFVVFFLLMIALTVVFITTLPFFSIDKTLPLNIGFFLNWKNNNFAYLVTVVYILISIIYSAVSTLPNIIIWYLMINYSLEYEILGFRFRDMGVPKPTTMKTLYKRLKKIRQPNTGNWFHRNLLELIHVHQMIQRNVDEFKSFFAFLFFVQIMTSGICICGSIYALTFTSYGYETLFLFVVYFTQVLYGFFEIFMVTYLGNDIMLSSNRLSYYLFESNWMEQSKSTQKCLIILAEKLQQPHELMIYKLYPLDLHTFTSILRVAYSMFSILLNM